MATANTKLTVDTSQAQQALKDLNTAWINATAGMQIVEKAFNAVAGAVGFVNDKIREQAKFFSAVKTDVELASVKMSMAASDGMIKPMTLAKGANTLMRGDLKLTQDQMDAVAKAAVELGRATGEDVNTVYDRLSKGVLKGSTEAMMEYGIQVSNTGTIQQKQTRILEEISRSYGSITIAATDAAEAQDAAANRLELQTIQAAKSLDGFSQKITSWKANVREGFAMIGDFYLGTSMSSKKQEEELVARLDEEMNRLVKINNENSLRLANMKNIYQLEVARGASAVELFNMRSQIGAVEADQVKNAEKMNTTGRALSAVVAETGVRYDNLMQLTNTIHVAGDAIAHGAKETAWYAKDQELAFGSVASIFKDDMLPAMQKIAALIPVTIDLKAWAYEGSKQQKKDMEDEKRRREQARAASAAEWARDAEAEKAAIAQFYQDRRTAKAEAALKEMRDERAAKDAATIASQEKDLAFEINKERQRREMDIARGEQIISEAERQARVAKEIKDRAAAEDKARLESIKAKTIEVSGVVLGAIFAEKKAREGLSRSEYVMKQLAVYMKGQALKYAAESLGYAAQAFAAQFINPPAAAAMWTASATAAAAASAFGLGAAGASKMAGKPASSSKGSGASSASTQRETVGGTTAQRANVTIVVGERAVLLGTMDDLMRAINGGINDARRRGVL